MILQVIIARVAGWINRHPQLIIAYQQEENRILKAKLGDLHIRFTDTERRRLAARACPPGRQCLKATATLATPDTLMRWYKRLVADKFDGSQRRNQMDRPRVPDDVEQPVIRMATENLTWGYRRIQGVVANLGHHMDRITVRNSLRRHPIDPAPRRRQSGMSWSQFLKIHWEVLAATDFFTDVEPVLLPPQSPNLYAHCERLVRSIKEEAVGRMIVMGEASLRDTLTQYLAHDHAERHHQGLDNQLIAPESEVGQMSGPVKRRQGLGGLLSDYYRGAA